jgi:hypothetical protein
MMALRDLATQPEIHITSEVLRRILFHPENYVQEAELVPQPEEHDYTGHPHSKCMDSPANFGAVCFYHALLKIKQEEEQPGERP